MFLQVNIIAERFLHGRGGIYFLRAELSDFARS